MAKKRKPFRFRFPWFSESSAPRPVTRPKDESKSSEQADSSIPIQGPPGKTPAQSPSTKAKEVPIADPQVQTPSHSPWRQLTFSVPIGSPEPYQPKPESLPSMSQPRSPERTGEESRLTTVESSTSKATSPSQQEKEKMVVSESKPEPEMSPLTTISKSQELTQTETSSHVSQPLPQPKMSPLKNIPESQELTQPKTSPQVPESVPQPETSSHVSETIPQPKDSPLKSISNSQKLTQLEISSDVSESVPQPRDSPLKSIAKSQELTQPESSHHVTELVPQPMESPLKSISKFQEVTQPETSSHVSETVPQPKDSPLKTIPKSQEVIQPETSSHMSEPVLLSEKSPLKTISKPQELTQPETSSQPKKASTKPRGMSVDEKGSTTTPKTPPVSKKFKLDSNGGNTKSPSETQSKFHQNEENEKVVHELPQEGNSENSTIGQANAVLHAKASPSGTKTKDQPTRTVRADRKKQDTRENIEKKVMLAASNSSKRDIKVVSSTDAATESVSSTSHLRDALSNGGKTPLKKGIIEDISKFVRKLATGQPSDPMEDNPVTAITLAGDNRGATMQIGSESTKKEGSIHIHNACKTDPEENQEVTSEFDDEEGSNNLVEEDEFGKACVNSNIQSINNSLLYHGSVTEKDPGVQLILPQKPAGSVMSDNTDSKG